MQRHTIDASVCVLPLPSGASSNSSSGCHLQPAIGTRTRHATSLGGHVAIAPATSPWLPAAHPIEPRVPLPASEQKVLPRRSRTAFRLRRMRPGKNMWAVKRETERPRVPLAPPSQQREQDPLAPACLPHFV